MTQEPGANEADVLDQRRAVTADEEPEEPVTGSVVEADPADVRDQRLPVPAEEEDWRGA